jgi:hypothetical protein
MTIASRLQRPIACSALLLPLLAAGTARAGELYVPLGMPGIGVGYAHPLNDSVAVRADFMTLGSRGRATVEDGISYQGRYKLQRTALLLDLFPFAGSFRLTGGAVLSNYKVNLDASGAGGSLTIGNTTYATTAADGLKVDIKFPDTTPYVGIGWGHQPGSGWRWSFDIGAAVGRAKLTATPRGALASQPGIQADIDKELAELREGVGRVRAIPQLSVGVGYSF